MYWKVAYSPIFLLAVIISLAPAFLDGPAMAMPKAEAPSDAPTASGTIIETMDASGYTYMLVETGAGQSWVAIPATTVEKGATVNYYEGMVMKNFTSKTLNRTFDAVVFSPGLAGQSNEVPRKSVQEDSFAAAVKAEKGVAVTSPDPAMAASGGSSGAIAPLEEISVEKSMAPNGYSVEEIFTKAKELSGKKIQVRGKVVKFSPLIMGKNWIHLQDGSGNPMQNSHDLVVTTGETVEVDSIVTMEGILAAEKDFGAGYKYAAIVEEASTVK